MPTYRFASFVYDSEKRVLRREGVVLHAEPKVLACVDALVRHPGVTLRTETLMAALWPDARVSPAALRRIILQVRKLLARPGEPELLVTMRQGGYRLAVDVTTAARGLRLNAMDESPSFEAVRTARRVLHIGPYALHTLERELRLDGRTVSLPSKALACLEILARVPNALVSHARLHAALGSERDVSAQSMKRVLRAVRAALSERADEVRVVARKGLGYVLEISAAAPAVGVQSEDAPPTDSARVQRLETDAGAPSGADDVQLAREALREAQALWRADAAPDAVHAAYRRAFECAQNAGDHLSLAEAAIGAAVGEESAFALADNYFRQRARTCDLEYALAQLPAQAGLIRHRVARTLCWVHGALGDPTAAHAAARVALEYMPAATEPALHAMAWAVACMESVWSQDRPRARSALQQLRAFSGSARLSAEQGIETHLQAMTLALVLGDAITYKESRAALAHLAEALPPSPGKRLHQRHTIFRLSATLSLVTQATIEGEFGEAERYLTEVTMLSQKLGLEASGDLGVYLLMVLPVMRYQGRAGLLRPLLDIAGFPDPLLRAVVALQVALDAGDLTQAAQHFALLRAHQFLRSNGACARTDVLVALADACVTLGRVEDARALHAMLLPWREFCASDGAMVSLGAVARALGELAFMYGDHAQAERSFKRALQLNRKLGHRPELVRTQLGLARVLEARGTHVEAARLAAVARLEAGSMGMEPWLASGVKP